MTITTRPGQKHNNQVAVPVKHTQSHRIPLSTLLLPARGVLREWTLFALICLAAALFRWATALWDFSGYGSPPMFGDFEAQRHWMEISIHLPVSKWYFYDLQWWGLDYPPLTAYHSWILGQIGSRIDSRWFALDSSRGLEEPTLKVFMRATVLVSEYLVFVPSLWMFVTSVSRHEQRGGWTASLSFAAILMQPSMILIDHGHFQYNTVMLGFALASVTALRAGNRGWACSLFVAALGFKQMALYYAPAIFAFHLGSCIIPRINPSRLLLISIATIASFCVLFLPLLASSILNSYNGTALPQMDSTGKMDTYAQKQEFWYNTIQIQLSQCVFRVFPFARGLFEDKVANLWCALHTFHKLSRYSPQSLQKISLLATIISILPPSIAVGLRPDAKLLPLAMTVCAWGFFLFSFQVHEKSVLLPLMPMTLLLTSKDGMSDGHRSWICWANLLGCWTMFPLLKRDQLTVPYFLLTTFWAWLMGVPQMIRSSLPSGAPQDVPKLQRTSGMMHTLFYAVMIIWHIAEASISPPPGKPDLWVVANVLIGAPGFALCYLWSMRELLTMSLQAGERGGENFKHRVKSKAN